MPDQVDDCRVALKDYRLSDWVGLKASCDNRTSCSYEYLGSVVEECGANQVTIYRFTTPAAQVICLYIEIAVFVLKNIFI